MSDLAEELGLSKAAIYHHFESKESILINLVNSTLLDMKALVHKFEAIPTTHLQVVEVLTQFADILFAHRQVVSLVLFQLPAEFRAHGQERGDYMMRLQQILAGKNPTRERRVRARAATTIIATGIVPPPFGKIPGPGQTDLALLVKIAVETLQTD